jgi:hypothetical protein
MRYHAERGNDQWHAADRWPGRWRQRGGWGRGASWDALPRGAWERSVARGGSVARTLAPARRDGDAERLEMRYHAERGNDQWHARIGGTDAGASAAGWGRGASRDALPRGAWERSVTRGGSVARTLAPARRDGDAERLEMRYHAERGNDQWLARIGGTDAGASAAGWRRGASRDALPRSVGTIRGEAA